MAGRIRFFKIDDDVQGHGADEGREIEVAQMTLASPGGDKVVLEPTKVKKIATA